MLKHHIRWNLRGKNQNSINHFYLDSLVFLASIRCIQPVILCATFYYSFVISIWFPLSLCFFHKLKLAQNSNRKLITKWTSNQEVFFSNFRMLLSFSPNTSRKVYNTTRCCHVHWHLIIVRRCSYAYPKFPTLASHVPTRFMKYKNVVANQWAAFEVTILLVVFFTFKQKFQHQKKRLNSRNHLIIFRSSLRGLFFTFYN